MSARHGLGLRFRLHVPRGREDRVGIDTEAHGLEKLGGRGSAKRLLVGLWLLRLVLDDLGLEVERGRGLGGLDEVGTGLEHASKESEKDLFWDLEESADGVFDGAVAAWGLAVFGLDLTDGGVAGTVEDAKGGRNSGAPALLHLGVKGPDGDGASGVEVVANGAVGAGFEGLLFGGAAPALFELAFPLWVNLGGR